jgi:hypothetical protein
MKRTAALAVVALTLALAPPAYADHDGGYNRGGDQGSGNERDEEYGDNSCKYVCPAFDKSPVQDSFNIQVCVQPGSCSEKEKSAPK